MNSTQGNVTTDKAQPAVSTRVLIVGSIMLDPNYASGVTAIVKQHMKLWSFPYPYEYVNTEPWPRTQESSGVWSVRNLFKSVVTYYRVIKKVFAWRPTVYHHHTSLRFGLLKDAVCCRLVRLVSKARIVLTPQWSDLETLFLTKNRALRQWQLHCVLGSCDCLVFLSENIRAEAKQLLNPKYVKEFERKTTILRNFTDYPTSGPGVLKRERSGRILFLAMMIERKGAHDLLAAYAAADFGDHPKPELVLAGPFGSTEYESRIRDLISRNRLENSVRLAGGVYGEEKDELLASSSIFVLPSYGEGMPLAILEAMAHGMAIVTTNVGGIPEAIRDGVEGILLAPGDVNGLANALTRLCRHPDEAERMGRAARERVDNEFSARSYFATLGKIYEPDSKL